MGFDATAFPPVREVRRTEEALRAPSVPKHLPGPAAWITRVREGRTRPTPDTPSPGTAPVRKRIGRPEDLGAPSVSG
ncbi:hypothetical protein ADL04_06315 [Streptomyces sp. NRRL B-3648]|nr:hypothetical protein ADL04_06315 [Streptomyces sp. NRRL B-3648]